MDLESLPKKIQFTYVAMSKVALIFKECGKDKNFFLDFCKEIWSSMELSDVEYLKDILNEKMRKDVESYLKNSKKEDWRLR